MARDEDLTPIVERLIRLGILSRATTPTVLARIEASIRQPTLPAQRAA